MRYFKEIKCPALRAWNQIQYTSELMESRGEDQADAYFNALTKPEKLNFTALATRIAAHGKEFVQKEVMNFSK